MAQRANPKNKKKPAPKKKLKGSVATLKTKAKTKRRGRRGDNSGDHALSDDDALYHQDQLDTARRKMKSIQEELDQQRGVYRSKRKTAKQAGFNLNAYDINVKLEVQDMGQVQVDYADAGRYLKLTGSPLAEQLQLFQNLEAPAPVVDVAMQGLNAGKGGEPADNNPHKPGSDNYALWEKNHKAGTEQAADGFRH